MPIQYSSQPVCGVPTNICVDPFGCPPSQCPDHSIRRHDTKPPFRVNVEDCDGPIDLTGLILEVNMWALAKLKKSIDATATYFSLADNIGFEQIMVGDTIIMDRVRSPEHMIVEGFDENNKLVLVQRGVHGTTPGVWKKGQVMRIFRIMNAPAVTEMSFIDIDQVDGTVLQDQLADSFLVYDWTPQDTCLPGCYWFEFKLIKMKDGSLYLPGGYWTGPTNEASNADTFTGTVKSNSSVLLSLDPKTDHYLLPKNTLWGGATHVWSEDGKTYTGTDHDDGSVFLDKTGIPSDETIGYNSGLSIISIDSDNTISTTPTESCDPSMFPIISSGAISDAAISFTEVCGTPTSLGCDLAQGVEWVRRYPSNTSEGFLIKIVNSYTPD